MDTKDFREAHENLIYEPWTGDLYWKFNTNKKGNFNVKLAGKKALHSNHTEGYKCGRFNGKHCLAHRIIWLMMTGECPKEIDHIDGNRSNNKWNNLRDGSRLQNTRNRVMSSNNTTTHNGIHYDSRVNGYRAEIYDNGTRYRKRFKKLKDAIAWRKEMEHKIGGYTERHGKPVDSH